MAEFLTTRKAVSVLDELLQTTSKTLVLISPYLQLPVDFRNRLAARDKRKLQTQIIYREYKQKGDDLDFLNSLRLVSIKCHEYLHAKCYFDEQKMIMGSLNLYESSMRNAEMCVLINKNDPADQKLFNDVLKEVEYIQANSKPSGLGAVQPLVKNWDANKAGAVKNYSAHGYCIRTGIPIPFNPEKPLCYEAYLKWDEYGNLDYPEQYCHFSGEPSHGETSFAFPILNKNWKKAKQLHGF